jgi:hypothetical protein
MKERETLKTCFGYGERKEETNEEEETPKQSKKSTIDKRKKDGNNRGIGRKLKKRMGKKGLERDENGKVEKEGRCEGGRQNKNGKRNRPRKAG